MGLKRGECLHGTVKGKTMATAWQRLVDTEGFENLDTPGGEHLGGFSKDGLEYWGWWEYTAALHRGEHVGGVVIDWDWHWGPDNR